MTVSTVFCQIYRENVFTVSYCQSVVHWAISTLALAADLSRLSVCEWDRQTAGEPVLSGANGHSPEPPDSRCWRTVNPSLLPSKTTRRAPPSSTGMVTSHTGSGASRFFFFFFFFMLYWQFTIQRAAVAWGVQIKNEIKIKIKKRINK